MRLAELLDVGRDMHRVDGGDRRNAGALALGRKASHVAGIGAARVEIADRGGEEFQEAPAGPIAAGGDEGREWDRARTDGRQRRRSRRLPGIDEREAAAFKAADIAGNDRRVMSAGRGRNNQIWGLNRPSHLTATGEKFGVDAGRLRIEREDASVKILTEDRLRHRFEFGASSTRRQDGDAGENFGLAKRGGEQRSQRLRSHPRGYGGRRPRLHGFRQHIGVEKIDHSKLGGSRIGPRGGSSSSTPPSGSKRARMRS